MLIVVFVWVLVAEIFLLNNGYMPVLKETERNKVKRFCVEMLLLYVDKHHTLISLSQISG